MHRLAITLTFLLGCITATLAQVSFTANVDREVEVGQKFYVTFRLKNAQGSGLKAPTIKGAKFIYGPATSSMSSTSIINGKRTAMTAVDYSFLYLAEKEGSSSVPATSITADGSTYSSSPVNFNIVAARTPHPSSMASPSRPTTSQLKKITDKDVFVRIILSKSKAVEQEAIRCTIKLYLDTDLGIDGQKSQIVQQPKFEGFMVEELDVPNGTSIESYNGHEYRTMILKEALLFPQRSGELTINSGLYTLTVQQYQIVNRGYYYEQRPIDTKIDIESNTASIEISPLPEAPDDFSGAVGRFEATSTLSAENLKTGEAGVLRYIISGTGNVRYIKEPKIDFPSGIDAYTPRSSQSAKVVGNNVTGTDTITYTFTPTRTGTYAIPAGKFVYYDLASQQYVTIDLPTYTINVEQGTSRPTNTDAAATNQKDIEVKNTDILPQHRNARGEKEATMVITQWYYWAIIGSLSMILIVTVILSAQRIKRNANVTARNYAKASKVARNRLKKAAALMKSHNDQMFYLEMTRAIWGYLSHKLAIPTSQLTRDNVSDQLLAYGAPQELVDKFIIVLDQCEMARYAPSATEGGMEGVYNTTSKAIDQMESLKLAKTVKA